LQQSLPQAAKSRSSRYKQLDKNSSSILNSPTQNDSLELEEISKDSSPNATNNNNATPVVTVARKLRSMKKRSIGESESASLIKSSDSVLSSKDFSSLTDDTSSPDSIVIEMVPMGDSKKIIDHKRSRTNGQNSHSGDETVDEFDVEKGKIAQVKGKKEPWLPWLTPFTVWPSILYGICATVSIISLLS
jgi:hypothetical protein